MRRQLEFGGRGLEPSYEEEKKITEALGMYCERCTEGKLQTLDVGITRPGFFEMSDFLVLQTLWENQLG